MCGLLGTLNVGVNLDRIRSLLANRGPDEVVAEQIGNATLCHGRLAVVGHDLPETRQPLHFRGITAIYNGYISNYVELNQRLEVANNAAEALAVIHSYARSGIKGLAYLCGQFAVALVDRDRGTLVLARDPMGICPLYYARPHSTGLVFASQAAWFLETGLLDLPPIAWKINERAEAQLKSFAYVLPDETLIAGIYEVPAGIALEFSLADGSLIGQYDLTRLDPGPTEPANAETVRDAIQDSVRRNLLGDTRPWLLLSGGLDSCIVLHCAVAAGVRPRAVTLNYPNRENEDEVVLAAEMAQHYGCTLRVVPFPPDAAQPSAELFRQRVDWPLDGGSLLPKVCLGNDIHDSGGRILLGGTGADELFGGYRRHLARLELLSRGMPSPSEERAYYRQWVANGSENDAVFQRFEAAAATGSFADPAFVYDLLEMQQQHNPRVDSCFANVGIEYRPVFQDARIVRLAGSLPLEDKTTTRAPKALLRQAFAGEIPAPFLSLPKKPLRFGEMGPNRAWREKIYTAWLESRSTYLLK